MKNFFIILIFIITLLHTSCSYEEKPTNEDVRIPIVEPTLDSIEPSIEPILTAENSPNIEDYNDYYEITSDNEDNYIITLYDINKNIIDEFSLPKEPYIGVLESNILQISISCGSPCNYTYFYNTETSDISDVYFNISLAEKGKVLYMGDRKFIISDIFDKTKYYKEIIRDFSPVAAECNDITEVKFLDDNTLLMNYLVGENFEIKQEIIELEETMSSITPSYELEKVK